MNQLQCLRRGMPDRRRVGRAILTVAVVLVVALLVLLPPTQDLLR
ncbi:MAG TPA: hypothetical protein P5063_06485 [Methanomassiliicoccales archaeon]|nr:hypothetical protein [Methanomassiliicoccales archaeon]